MNLTKRTDQELRALQGEAVNRCLEAVDQAREINVLLCGLDVSAVAEYQALDQRWRVLIAEAQRWGDLVPRVTVELERRAQARLTNA